MALCGCVCVMGGGRQGVVSAIPPFESRTETHLMTAPQVLKALASTTARRLPSLSQAWWASATRARPGVPCIMAWKPRRKHERSGGVILQEGARPKKASSGRPLDSLLLTNCSRTGVVPFSLCVRQVHRPCTQVGKRRGRGPSRGFFRPSCPYNPSGAASARLILLE